MNHQILVFQINSHHLRKLNHHEPDGKNFDCGSHLCHFVPRFTYRNGDDPDLC